MEFSLIMKVEVQTLNIGSLTNLKVRYFNIHNWQGTRDHRVTEHLNTYLISFKFNFFYWHSCTSLSCHYTKLVLVYKQTNKLLQNSILMHCMHTHFPNCRSLCTEAGAQLNLMITVSGAQKSHIPYCYWYILSSSNVLKSHLVFRILI